MSLSSLSLCETRFQVFESSSENKIKFFSKTLKLSDRYRTDNTTRTIPLRDVNETKVAILEENGIEAELEGFYKNLFLIQDLYASGYRMPDVGPDENGLVNIQV